MSLRHGSRTQSQSFPTRASARGSSGTCGRSSDSEARIRRPGIDAVRRSQHGAVSSRCSLSEVRRSSCSRTSTGRTTGCSTSSTDSSTGSTASPSSSCARHDRSSSSADRDGVEGSGTRPRSRSRRSTTVRPPNSSSRSSGDRYSTRRPNASLSSALPETRSTRRSCAHAGPPVRSLLLHDRRTGRTSSSRAERPRRPGRSSSAAR